MKWCWKCRIGKIETFSFIAFCHCGTFSEPDVMCECISIIKKSGRHNDNKREGKWCSLPVTCP